MPKIDKRSTEQSASDPVGSDVVREVAIRLRAAVGDPTVHPSIFVRVARAVVERRIPADEVARLCDAVTAKSLARELDSPGAYFIASIKRLFQRHEVPWRTPRSGPRTDLFGGGQSR